MAASRSRASLKVRAVLAGALVLGVGSTMTLAAWTDNEYATGSFTASVFDTESTTTSLTAGWADNTTANGATITFNGTGMSPDTHRYGWVLIRTKQKSIDGTLAFAAPTVTNGTGDTSPLLGSALQVKGIVTTAAACTSTSFTTGTPTYVVGTSAAYAAIATGSSQNTAIGAAGASTPGTPVGFCFDVYLPAGADNGLQGKSATVTWRVVATSSS